MLVGREKDLRTLEELYSKPGFALAGVYGRSGMGKTALLQEFLRDKNGLHFTALEAGDVLNVRSFTQQLAALLPQAAAATSWEEAFTLLAQHNEEQRFVLVLDEFYHLAHTAVCAALRTLAQTEGAQRIMVVISSSQFSFMEGGLMSAKSPLAGLLGAVVALGPLPYYEAAQLLDGFSDKEKLVLYACLGGAPQYLALVDSRLTLLENLEQLYLRPSGFFYNATLLLLKQELRELTLYNSIMLTVAQGVTRMNEIAATLEVAPNTLNCYLRTLCSLHLLERICPVGEDARRSKKTQYVIKDNHYYFWYHFVFTLQGVITLGRSEQAVQQVARGLDAYMQQGPFRDICQQFLRHEACQGRLPFVPVQNGTWWGMNPRLRLQQSVDLVFTDEGGKVLLASCLWEQEKSDVEALAELRAKRDLFAEYGECYYALLSRAEFSEELRSEAARDEQLLLYKLPDLLAEAR